MNAYTFESLPQAAYLVLRAKDVAEAIATVRGQGLDPLDGVLKDVHGNVVVVQG